MSTASTAVSLPTLADIDRRRRELLAFEAWQQAEQLSEPLVENEDENPETPSDASRLQTLRHPGR